MSPGRASGDQNARRRTHAGPTRRDGVAKDRRASAADRDEWLYARKRAALRRRRVRQERDSFDPAPPVDADWTVEAPETDGLQKVTPPTAVGETLRTLIERQGWGERLRGATAASRWQDIVGAELVRRCEPVRLDRGTLTIRAENQVWATQLRYMLPHLRTSAESVLGTGTVREVVIVIGRLQGHGDAVLGEDRPPGGSGEGSSA